LIVPKSRPFSQEEFSRKGPATILGVTASIVTPEDSILSKLEWSVESDSQRQYRDAMGVAILNRRTLDVAYLKKRATELCVASVLEKLLTEAER